MIKLPIQTDQFRSNFAKYLLIGVAAVVLVFAFYRVVGQFYSSSPAVVLADVDSDGSDGGGDPGDSGCSGCGEEDGNDIDGKDDGDGDDDDCKKDPHKCKTPKPTETPTPTPDDDCDEAEDCSEPTPEPSDEPDPTPESTPEPTPDDDCDEAEDCSEPTPEPTPTPSPSPNVVLQCPQGQIATIHGTTIICIQNVLSQSQTQTSHSESKAEGGQAESSSASNPEVNVTGGAVAGGGEVAGVTTEQPQVIGKGGVEAKELPKTGMGLLSWGLAMLLPIGLRFRRIYLERREDNPNSTWIDRQLKRD